LNKVVIAFGILTIPIKSLIGPKGKHQKNMRDLLPNEIYEYACEDADITLQLKNVLEPKLKSVDAEKLFWEIEMPLVPVLADMELHGVRLDTAALEETSHIFTQRMKQYEQEIYELAGESFNISSPKQVGDILFGKLQIMEKPKKTKTGQYVTSEEVMVSLENKHPIVHKILEYRGIKKLLSTYIDALPKLIKPQTGHIHTSFNQALTATGRLSSSDPNLQNIPVRTDDGKEIRKCFIPEPGCKFFSADYSQIELRIMAHLSEDENMMEAFREGVDIHRATAAKIWHEDLNDVSDIQRKKAKQANFGIIYGITTFGLAQRSLDEVEASLNSNRSVLREEFEATRGNLLAIQDQLFAGLNDANYFIEKPRELFQLRIDIVDVVANSLLLELQASGGRGYLKESESSFIRRWNEGVFLPIVSPSAVQLRHILAAS